MALNNRHTAMRDLSILIAHDAGNSIALTKRAELFALMKEWQASLADADQALTLADDNYSARCVRAVSNFHLARFQPAIQDLEWVLNSNEPDHADHTEFQWMLIQAFQHTGQPIKAQAAVETFLKKNPQHYDALLVRARMAESRGLFEEAIRDLSTILEARPDDAETWKHRGVLQHRSGRSAEAVYDFSRAMKIVGDNADLLYHRGLAQHQLKQSDDALQDLNTAIGLQPDFADAWYVRGNVYASIGNVAFALENYKRTIELNPDHTAAWYNRGNILFHETDYAAAIECWTEAIRTQPDLFRAYNNRATAWVRMEQPARAAGDYERTIALNPGFARAFDNFAWLLATSDDRNIRDTTRAVELAKTACELTQYQQWSHLSTLAAAYAEAGEFTKAVEWAEKALALAPDSQKEDLTRLIRLYETPSSSRGTNRETASRSNSGTRR